MKAETAEQLVDALVKGLDEALLKMKPDLDKLEADLLKGMETFGADHAEVESVRQWLRPMIDAEVKKEIFKAATKGL